MADFFKDISRELLVIQYGNAEGDDLDLLVVSPKAPYHQQVRLGALDVTILPVRLAVHLAAHKDILISTPLSQGSLVHSDGSTFDLLLRELQSSRPRHSIVSHHLSQSTQCRQNAEQLLRLAEQELSAASAEIYCHSLAWYLSYFVAAKMYVNEKEEVLTFDDLLASPYGTELTKIRCNAKVYGKGERAITVKALKALFERVDRMLIDASG